MDKMRNRSSKIGSSRSNDVKNAALVPPRTTTIVEIKNKPSKRSSNRKSTLPTGLALLLIISYWYWTSSEYMTPERIAEWSSNKTIIITGANSVVSLGVLTHLVRADTAHHIIMTCRSVDRCQATLNQVQEEVAAGTMGTPPPRTKISLVPLDLTSRESIQACAQWILESQSRISTGSTSANNNNNNNTTILVWNAHDSVHDPIAVNGGGHLYLTHLLYPHLQRIVVATSIVGGWPWNVVPPWKERANHYPSWWEGVAHYGISKRTMLYLGRQIHQLQQQQQQQPSGRGRLQVIATQAGLTREETEGWSVMSMTPHQGALSHLRAMLDPMLKSGTYVGHRWVLGTRGIVGPVLLVSLAAFSRDSNQSVGLESERMGNERIWETTITSQGGRTG